MHFYDCRNTFTVLIKKKIIPQNGFLLNDLKKVKNLTGKERIPVYTTTKSVPTKYTTVDEILAEVPVPTPQTIETDGVTITGSGTLADPLVAVSASGGLNYSNVAFVDKTVGNDATAVVGDASKPYLNLQTAMNAISALSPTVNAPGLVYARKGVYGGPNTFRNYTYVYCDPGVIFTGGFVDDVNSGVCKLLGYAKFYNTPTALSIGYSSTVYFEFDELYHYNTGNRSLWGSVEAGYSANVVISCNKYYSASLAYDISIRGNINWYMYVKHEFKAAYSTFFRVTAGGVAFNGTFVLQCPNIILEDGGPQGNNSTYKRLFRIESTPATSKVIINGSMIDQCTAYYGGQHALLTTVSNSAGFYVEINGNQKAGKSLGIYNQDGSNIRLNGNITGEVRCLVNTSSGSISVENGKVTKLANASYVNSALYLAGTSKTFLRNCDVESKDTNANVVDLYAVGTKLYAHNCQLFGTGTGYSIGGNGTAPSVGLINVRANLVKDAAVTEAYTPAGLTVDTALIVPTF